MPQYRFQANHMLAAGTHASLPARAALESLLYASRWLLAPIYLGPSLALLLLGIRFFQEALHTLPLVLQMKEADLVLVTLVLVGGLMIMVMQSGYENIVSRIDVVEERDKLTSLGNHDFGSLKQMVAASMNEQQISNDKLLWYVLIQLNFVDRMNSK